MGKGLLSHANTELLDMRQENINFQGQDRVAYANRETFPKGLLYFPVSNLKNSSGSTQKMQKPMQACELCSTP